ncbi:MAG TPA: dipeptidase [Candidatus Gallibacteroides avistercoris]|uniref:Dipeptidase n=1 Tax=Candidatus Gallibacteroides avistercoris TaxID=2840833 RepID=A0A9D1M8Q9_9BACT|nr:dipeptidase [Candidatus Gallibacteroides avistercoris]
MEIKAYLSANREQIIADLASLIRIPSVSAQPEHRPDMLRCAERWRELLIAAGADTATVMETDGNPVVFASKTLSPDRPTVLIYAHYDVMPAEPVEQWRTPPFELTREGGYFRGRGTDDDKGQSFIQVKGFEYALRNGDLRCNVKFLFEGEEEIGSPSLEQFCRKNKELLKADVILVSDTSMVSAQTPSITTGLRGLAYWQIAVTGPNRDLHSGIFGGAVANPINELCKLIAHVTDDRGRITIPGFYDDVEEVSPEERAMIAAIPHDEAAYRKAVGVNALQGESGYNTLERASIRPTFDVCGIWGGYTGEGAKTVLPSQAFAKVSCRLVPHQDYKKISELFIRYIEQTALPCIQVSVTPLHGGQGYVCPITLPAYQAAEEAYQAVFGQKPLAVRRGGSIPIIAVFEEVLGIKSVLMGLGLESDATHSPNENFPEKLFFQGIEIVAEFYKRFGHDTTR